MIIFSSLGGAGISFSDGTQTLEVYPEKVSGNADLVLHTTPTDEVEDGAISWPGEYDYDGISIRGIGHDEGDRVSYAIEAGGARSAFLSTPLHDWTDNELELLGDVDILFIPADDAKLAQKIIDEVDPRVLVPLKTGDADTQATILKNCGAEGQEVTTEYKNKGSLPAEGREVIVLD